MEAKKRTNALPGGHGVDRIKIESANSEKTVKVIIDNEYINYLFRKYKQ